MLEHLQSWEMMIGFFGKAKRFFWGMILVPECVAKDSRFYILGSGGGKVFAWPCFWCPKTVRARPSWQKSWSMGEANKNVSFSKCQKMWSCSFCVAGAALCDIRCVCVCACAAVVRVKSPCPLGKPQKRVFLHMSEGMVMSFCVAGMALCEIRSTCFRRNWGCATVAKVKLQCLWGKPPKNMSCSKCQKMCSCRFCVASVALLCDIPCVFKRNVCARPSWRWSHHVYGGPPEIAFLDASEDVLLWCVSREFVCGAVVPVKLPCLWWKPQKRAPYFTLHTLHFTLHIPQFTLYTFALHIPHSTLHTLRSTLPTLHSTLYTPHSTLHTPHFTLHTSHSTLHTPHSTLSTLHSTLYTPHSPLQTLHSTFHTPHSTLYTPHLTSTFDSASPYIRFLCVICIRVRWFLLFFSRERLGEGFF